MTGIVVLPANQPPRRPYRGGPQIAAFRGAGAAGDDVPEDWVASTTPLFGQDRLGLSRLPDGRLLAEAVAAAPEVWLGPEHVAAFGADPRLLTKLLDAGQRLFVHAHPDDAFATAHRFSCGKAEAWFVLAGGPIHLGLRRPTTHDELLRLAHAQDVDGLLALLNETVVRPGDIVAVPPGVLHAVGAGVFVVELQQAADLSILLEWRDFPVDGMADGNLGLGLDVAVTAVEVAARADLGELIRPAGFGASVLPAVMDPYLRLERWAVTDGRALAPGFGVLVVTAGEVVAAEEFVAAGEVGTAGRRLAAGTTAVIPYAAGAVTLRGTGEVLVARPPSP